MATFLLEAHFKDPVVDSEKIVLEFETFGRVTQINSTHWY